ncbi:MAG TPA: hypothetical protein VMN36_01415 [Verrucomicrobiales bacterium]|nr:hypothetical protein [Verrucomicrobiales bacterium]
MNPRLTGILAAGFGFACLPESPAADRDYPVEPSERGEAACVSLPQFSYDVYLPSEYLHDGPPSPVIYTISLSFTTPWI